MTLTPPKDQPADLDVELPVADGQLSAAGNLSSAFPAPLHLGPFHKRACIQPQLPSERDFSVPVRTVG